MHLCVTSKNVKWCHLIWPTLYDYDARESPAIVLQWYGPYGMVDTRDTCAVSRYFSLLRYTAIYRDLGDTGIVT